ncbi:MAG: hypothetical protein E7310_02730 [Clostridiales bacterium]|nr:hypothetical protein [Clostridiales bacterium]
MSKLDLSLDGILDSRWSLKEIGEGKFKLEYNGLKGIPSGEETRRAVGNVLYAKRLSSLYISGYKGDIEITASEIADFNFPRKSIDDTKHDYYKKRDILGTPFGAEEDLMIKEEREII